jgi:hypothetical protein
MTSITQSSRPQNDMNIGLVRFSGAFEFIGVMQDVSHDDL